MRWTTALLSAGLFAAVWLAIPSDADAQEDEIWACVNNGSGTIHIVSEEDRLLLDPCTNNEMLLIWNAVGPEGPQGPQGEPGPPGEPGEPGPPGAGALVVEAPPSSVRQFTPVPQDALEELCGDLDGCLLTIAIDLYPAPVAKAGQFFYVLQGTLAGYSSPVGIGGGSPWPIGRDGGAPSYSLFWVQQGSSRCTLTDYDSFSGDTQLGFNIDNTGAGCLLIIRD